MGRGSRVGWIEGSRGWVLPSCAISECVLRQTASNFDIYDKIGSLASQATEPKTSKIPKEWVCGTFIEYMEVEYI